MVLEKKKKTILFEDKCEKIRGNSRKLTEHAPIFEQEWEAHRGDSRRW